MKEKDEELKKGAKEHKAEGYQYVSLTNFNCLIHLSKKEQKSKICTYSECTYQKGNQGDMRQFPR